MCHDGTIIAIIKRGNRRNVWFPIVQWLSGFHSQSLRNVFSLDKCVFKSCMQLMKASLKAGLSPRRASRAFFQSEQSVLKQSNLFVHFTLAPIWLPHWPACRCTISRMMQQEGHWRGRGNRTEGCLSSAHSRIELFFFSARLSNNARLWAPLLGWTCAAR